MTSREYHHYLKSKFYITIVYKVRERIRMRITNQRSTDRPCHDKLMITSRHSNLTAVGVYTDSKLKPMSNRDSYPDSPQSEA